MPENQDSSREARLPILEDILYGSGRFSDEYEKIAQELSELGFIKRTNRGQRRWRPTRRFKKEKGLDKIRLSVLSFYGWSMMLHDFAQEAKRAKVLLQRRGVSAREYLGTRQTNEGYEVFTTLGTYRISKSLETIAPHGDVNVSRTQGRNRTGHRLPASSTGQ